MIWLALVLMAAAAMAPLALSLNRDAAARNRRDAAVALHRAQLVELDRDLAEGRIEPAEHTNAVLEVQRRLLAAAEAAEAAPARSSRRPLVIVLAMVPIAAFALYITGGSPFLPAAPLGERIARAEAQAREELALLSQLRRAFSPSSTQKRETNVAGLHAAGERRSKSGQHAGSGASVAYRSRCTLRSHAGDGDRGGDHGKRRARDG